MNRSVYDAHTNTSTIEGAGSWKVETKVTVEALPIEEDPEYKTRQDMALRVNHWI